MTQILLIDDDKELCHGLQRLLRMDGFELSFVHDARDGLLRAVESTFELIVLDVMLPGGDGRVLLRKLRTSSDVPVIMLTARGDEKDRILGLELGADDYLPKPFNVRELIARMRAVLKRKGAEASLPLLHLGDIEIHPVLRQVKQKGEALSLTGTEFEILLVLARSAGRVVTRDEIAEACLGRSIGAFDRSVDNHISNLRKKLGPAPDGNERIQSLRGVGYLYIGESQQ
ncbi:MAG: response regulator transcription factor [Acidobacteriaceae bacterium]|nr:response regulator transcription factor [Acidobacteriaceae bacterium]